MITEPESSAVLPAPLTGPVAGRAARLTARLSDTFTRPPEQDLGADLGPRSSRWWDQSLSKGAAGVAVLHGARRRPDLVHHWLTRATREDISAADGCGLWFGAPALAFTLSVAAPGRYPTAAATVDTAVTGLVHRRLHVADARLDVGTRPTRSEFDLVRGLSGLGAYLLYRNPDGELLRTILSYLVRLTEPLATRYGDSVPGWWTDDIPAGSDGEEFRDGHADLGMAHGISGPLALLALAATHNVLVAGQTEAIERICAWLDHWRQPGKQGVWWPQRITPTELRTGHTSRSGPRRPSWCYGTPGLARAQQLAGLALNDPGRQDMAEQALLRCISDPGQLAGLVDSTLCHGWAGAITTTWCAAHDARGPDLGTQLPALVDQAIEHFDDPAPETATGLIDGAAGLALALHSIATGTANGWTRCLLLT